MRSSGTRTRLYLAMTGAPCILLLGACSSSGSSTSASSPATAGTSTATSAEQVFDAVEAGQIEVLADERTRFIKASLPRDHELIYPPVQAFWDSAVTGS